MIENINCATKDPYIHTVRYSSFIFITFQDRSVQLFSWLVFGTEFPSGPRGS